LPNTTRIARRIKPLRFPAQHQGTLCASSMAHGPTGSINSRVCSDICRDKLLLRSEAPSKRLWIPQSLPQFRRTQATCRGLQRRRPRTGGTTRHTTTQVILPGRQGVRGVRIPDAPPLPVELKIGSQRQRVPISGLKMDPLPGQGVTGALNWALDSQIPRTLVDRRTRARHRGDTRANSMQGDRALARWRTPARTATAECCKNDISDQFRRSATSNSYAMAEMRPLSAHEASTNDADACAI
jgi:hypothetical protein